MGIRTHVYPLREKNSELAGLDASLQLCASAYGSWQKTSSLKAERRVNNVLTLYT
ncbi:hypothetical protein Bwad002_07790 [Bilophila wadsworthia]